MSKSGFAAVELNQLPESNLQISAAYQGIVQIKLSKH